MDKIKVKYNGSEVYATELTVGEFEEVQSKAGETTDMEFNRIFVAASIRDEAGNRVFASTADILPIGIKAFKKLQMPVALVNGMADDEKN